MGQISWSSQIILLTSISSCVWEKSDVNSLTPFSQKNESCAHYCWQFTLCVSKMATKSRWHQNCAYCRGAIFSSKRWKGDARKQSKAMQFRYQNNSIPKLPDVSFMKLMIFFFPRRMFLLKRRAVTCVWTPPTDVTLSTTVTPVRGFAGCLTTPPPHSLRFRSGLP